MRFESVLICARLRFWFVLGCMTVWIWLQWLDFDVVRLGLCACVWCCPFAFGLVSWIRDWIGFVVGFMLMLFWLQVFWFEIFGPGVLYCVAVLLLFWFSMLQVFDGFSALVCCIVLLYCCCFGFLCCRFWMDFRRPSCVFVEWIYSVRIWF